MFPAPYLHQTTSLHPLTTAHLAVTMSLLELSAAELGQKIEAELANNPALELKEVQRCPICHRIILDSGLCPRCTLPKQLSSDEPIVFVSPRDDFHISKYNAENIPDDQISDTPEDLPTYVLRQITPDLPTNDRQIAAHILTNLDEDGLLETSLIEIARYHHVPLTHAETVLRIIQRAEPIGVGSPTSQAALLVQLEVLLENTPGQPMIENAMRAVKEGMELLSRRQYPELARLLGITSHQAQEIAGYIGDNLNPFPARAFWGDIHQGRGAKPSVYSHPDVLITPLNRTTGFPFIIEIVSPFLGMLQISPLFRQALADAPREKYDQWKSDLEHADLLIKCLQQRTHTMVRLMRRIIMLQLDFILNGDEHLRPMTRASMAIKLEVHESTISRAVAGKTVQLPNGHIIPLAKFFDRSLHVRTVIKQIINKEAKPLSDSDIVELLQKQGYYVARRTVAKYRAMEGILPSFLREPQNGKIHFN